MAGCLLIHVGLDLTREGLWDSLRHFDSFEYAGVVLIAATMTILGMTTGLGLGMVLSALSFTLQHMRHSEPIRGTMPATTLRSSANRSQAEKQILDEKMRWLLVVQLQGTLFFGNATTLLSRCEDMLHDWEMAATAAQGSSARIAMILDFTLVRSLESSAAETIAKIYLVAQKHGAALVYNRGSTDGFPTAAPLSSRLESQLECEADSPGRVAALQVTDELDEALAWVEEYFIAEARCLGRLPKEERLMSDADESLPLRQLRKLCPEEFLDMLPRLLGKMRRREVEAGEVLWKQGSKSDFCFLLSEGLLENHLEEEAGTSEYCWPGCLVGEYHFLQQVRRMGTLSAKDDSVIYVIDRSAWSSIHSEDPLLACILYRISIHYLGVRCNHVSNRIWDTKCLPI
eukprot:TRINITY_DN7989_c0_g1_i1.p1 TRINITY_DN7989_c0_g1~~TRINITY_DN7989_c0_g1_i1.p1  ORF type:complete len:401 (-),score=69.02 TRINITY_DN7989_c0_g1_i1:65-1267(-)